MIAEMVEVTNRIAELERREQELRLRVNILVGQIDNLILAIGKLRHRLDQVELNYHLEHLE